MSIAWESHFFSPTALIWFPSTAALDGDAVGRPSWVSTIFSDEFQTV